jgi:hypothetical protein
MSGLVDEEYRGIVVETSPWTWRVVMAMVLAV